MAHACCSKLAQNFAMISSSCRTIASVRALLNTSCDALDFLELVTFFSLG
jgi:hypothetical protein